MKAARSAGPCRTSTCGPNFRESKNPDRQCCSSNGKPFQGTRVKMTSTIQRKQSPLPKVVTKEEYAEYQAIVQPPPKTDAEADEQERDRLLTESIRRREEFRRIDAARSREDGKLSEIDEEARRRTSHILERAEAMRLEQEEEIQRCNRIILETKCRAVRDAQVEEKRQLELELGNEERRLNDMMENERRWAIKEELRKEQLESNKRRRFVTILKSQIQENEDQRLLEQEKRAEESRLINLSNMAWQEAEIERTRNKMAENEKIRRDLAMGNEQLRHLKAMEEEEERIIDLRIKEYQRAKEEREAKLAEERRQERLKKERDKQTVASRALQTHDIQAHIEEINAARIQEEVEREWRQREKEEAIKRAEAVKLLQKQREDQINSRKTMQAIELERERREFERIVRVQKEAYCREKEELERKQKESLKHRREILKQVNEKEKERIEARQKMFEEGLAIRTETEMRRRKLREAMEQKCAEMRRNRVPEVYVNEVKRMIESIE